MGRFRSRFLARRTPSGTTRVSGSRSLSRMGSEGVRLADAVSHSCSTPPTVHLPLQVHQTPPHRWVRSRCRHPSQRPPEEHRSKRLILLLFRLWLLRRRVAASGGQPAARGGALPGQSERQGVPRQDFPGLRDQNVVVAQFQSFP